MGKNSTKNNFSEKGKNPLLNSHMKNHMPNQIFKITIVVLLSVDTIWQPCNQYRRCVSVIGAYFH